MRWQPATLGIVLLLPGLGGCIGGSESAGVAGPADLDPDALAVEGLVVDQELVPVAQAMVAVDGIGLVSETDAEGRFRLGPLEVGEYVIVAEKRGYSPASQTVRVSDEGTPPVTLTLSALALDVPYHQTEVHVTFMICWISSQIGNIPCTKLVDYVAGTNLSSSEKFAFPFRIANPGLSELLVEHQWRAQSTARDMTFFIKTPPNQPLTALVVKYFQVWGGAPLRGWVKANVKNGPNWAVFDATPNKVTYEGTLASHYTNSTLPNAAIYLNHRVDSWFTFFYNRPGSRDFTALPDR